MPNFRWKKFWMMDLIARWIHPDGKSGKKGGTKICVRLIEYTIDSEQGKHSYRLITSLLDTAVFPALLL
jgi:hypothetical protein